MTLPTDRARRRIAVGLAAAACALAQHSLSILDVHAAPAAATTSVSQQDGGSPTNPLPAIICDIPSAGDALQGQALAVSSMTCTGVEDQVAVTATWTDTATNTVLSSDSETISSPTINYQRQDSMSRGTPGAREFDFCITVHAVGFSDDHKCNQLTGL